MNTAKGGRKESERIANRPQSGRTFRILDKAGMAQALKAQIRGDKAGVDDGMHPQLGFI